MFLIKKSFHPVKSSEVTNIKKTVVLITSFSYRSRLKTNKNNQLSIIIVKTLKSVQDLRYFTIYTFKTLKLYKNISIYLWQFSVGFALCLTFLIYRNICFRYIIINVTNHPYISFSTHPAVYTKLPRINMMIGSALSA